MACALFSLCEKLFRSLFARSKKNKKESFNYRRLTFKRGLFIFGWAGWTQQANKNKSSRVWATFQGRQFTPKPPWGRILSGFFPVVWAMYNVLTRLFWSDRNKQRLTKEKWTNWPAFFPGCSFTVTLHPLPPSAFPWQPVDCKRGMETSNTLWACFVAHKRPVTYMWSEDESFSQKNQPNKRGQGRKRWQPPRLLIFNLSQLLCCRRDLK